MNSKDIVKVIGGYLPLERSGKEFRFLCPFHLGRHSSFYVDPTRQRWRCHHCGARGDAAGFVSLYEGISRKQAQEKIQNAEQH